MTLEPGNADEAALPQQQDLDALFGELLQPHRVDPLEAQVSPKSMQRLAAHSAELLRAFMNATERGLGVTSYVYCALPILWVADQNGDVLFAVEEVVVEDTREFAFPRLPRFRVEQNYQRLGHPALLAGGPGRIGGEIVFDVRAQPAAAWYIRALWNLSG